MNEAEQAQSVDPLVARLTAKLAAANARADALHEALRAEVVRADQPIYDDKWSVVGWQYQCGVCEQTFADDGDERHAPGCLAAPAKE